MTEERILSAIDAEGLTPSPTSMADFFEDLAASPNGPAVD